MFKQAIQVCIENRKNTHYYTNKALLLALCGTCSFLFACGSSSLPKYAEYEPVDIKSIVQQESSIQEKKPLMSAAKKSDRTKALFSNDFINTEHTQEARSSNRSASSTSNSSHLRTRSVSLQSSASSYSSSYSNSSRLNYSNYTIDDVFGDIAVDNIFFLDTTELARLKREQAYSGSLQNSNTPSNTRPRQSGSIMDRVDEYSSNNQTQYQSQQQSQYQSQAQTQPQSQSQTSALQNSARNNSGSSQSYFIQQNNRSTPSVNNSMPNTVAGLLGAAPNLGFSSGSNSLASRSQNFSSNNQSIESLLQPNQGTSSRFQELDKSKEKNMFTGSIPAQWQHVYNRLAADNIRSDKLDYFFSQLGTVSQDPMGRKITELYKNSFVQRASTASKANYSYPPAGFEVTGPTYQGVVTVANAKKCRAFIEQYPDAFHNAQIVYGVPPDIAAALLFVETRLGTYLGSENAFRTLASMATTRNISEIPTWVAKLPNNPNSRKDWINKKMIERSDWAYKEFKALTIHILDNNLDPFKMPGSIYGAIGLCQFMPSNLKPYGADGNGDGSIDLFVPEDAILSLSKYLNKHGWKANGTLSQRQAVLKKYNNLTVYANTILALAEQIRRL